FGQESQDAQGQHAVILTVLATNSVDSIRVARLESMVMSTFILVPGGWRGGWYFRPIADALRHQGHAAFPVTLTGLGDRAHLLTAATNLDTHIQDVMALLEAEDIHDAVLVGHSYARMVITAAAARAPGRVRRLVYGHAYVPGDGDSCYDLTTQAFRELFIQGAQADGHT